LQPIIAIPRLAKPLFGHQTAHTDRHCASEKQPAKADHISVAVLNLKFNSLFMYHSVYGEKLNLLTWVIRLIFSDPVSYNIISLHWCSAFVTFPQKKATSFAH